MGNTGRARRRANAAPFLVRVIVVLVVGYMALQKVLAGEGFCADVADEPFAEGVRLDVSSQVFRPGVPLLAMGTLIESQCAVMAGNLSVGRKEVGRWH